jgi:hypothetical protein
MQVDTMLKQFKTGAIALAFAAAIAGCSSEEESAKAPSQPIVKSVQLSGAVIDGYLINATVCLDLNKDGNCQIPAEPYTTTDLNGNYTLPEPTAAQQQHVNYATAPILVVGGIDSGSGKPYFGKMLALQSGDTTRRANVTAFTTLVAEITSQLGVASSANIKAAEAKVRQIFQIPDSIAIDADPIEELTKAAAGTQQTDAKAFLAQQVAIHRAIETLTTAATTDRSTATSEVFKALATTIKSKIESNSTTTADSATLITEVDLPTAAFDSSKIKIVQTAAAATATKTVEVFKSVEVTATTDVANAVQNADIVASSVVEAVNTLLEDSAQTIDTIAAAAATTANETATSTTTALVDGRIGAFLLMHGVIQTSDEAQLSLANKLSVTGTLTLDKVQQALNLFQPTPAEVETRDELQARLSDKIKLDKNLAANAVVLRALTKAEMQFSTQEMDRFMTQLRAAAFVVGRLEVTLAEVKEWDDSSQIVVELKAMITRHEQNLALADYLVKTLKMALTDGERRQLLAMEPIIGDLTLLSLHDQEGLPQSVANTIAQRVAAVDDVIDYLAEQGITVNDTVNFYEIDFIGVGLSLASIKAVESLPNEVVIGIADREYTLAKQEASQEVIDFLEQNEIELTQSEKNALNQLDLIAIAESPSLTLISDVNGLPTELKQKVDDRLEAIAIYNSYMTALYQSTPFESSVTCPAGGMRVSYAIDVNRNQLMDDGNKTTVEVCNGANGAPAVVVAEAPVESCPQGGKLLHMGETIVPLCNITSITALADRHNYAAAQALVAGLKEWVATLEQHGNALIASAEAQQEKITLLLESGGVVATLDGLALLVDAISRLVSEELAQTDPMSSDFSLSLAELLADHEAVVMNQASELNGTISYQHASHSLVVSSDLGLTLSVQGDGYQVSLGLAAIELPPLAESDELSATLRDLHIATEGASLELAELALAAGFATAVDPLAPEEMPDHLTLQLGSEQTPLTLRSEMGSDRLEFRGSLAAELEFNAGDLTALRNGHFSGTLEHNGQVVSLNIGLDIPRMMVDDYTPFLDFLGVSELGVGTRLPDEVTVTASGIAFEALPTWFSPRYPQLGEPTVTRFDFTRRNSSSHVSLLLLEYGSGLEATAEYYYAFPYYPGAAPHEYQYSFAGEGNTLSMRDSLRLSGLQALYSNGYATYDGHFHLFMRFDTANLADGWLDVAAVIDNTALPLAGTPTHYDLTIAHLSLGEQRPSYSNHNRYTLTATLGLQDIQSGVDGAALEDVTLNLMAQRSGYLDSSGTLSIGIEMGEQSFTAHYGHPNLELGSGSFAYAMPLDYYLADLSYHTRRMVFSDNQGGVIEFVEPQFDYWSDRVTAATLYYHGIRHGVVEQTWNGDWIVSYDDVDLGEEILYRANR